jgi:phosphatidylserine/phosphatidylglycerophosphate/cardiolipin synthase-like enzyme
VPRFGMRRFPLALAALAAIFLAIGGCLAAVVPAHAASAYSLVILPDQGENAIYNFVNSATGSVNVTIYELNATTLVNDLVAREKAGVDVRVILDQAEKSYNTAADNALTAGGVGVVWSSTAFTYTHQKTITVKSDGDDLVWSPTDSQTHLLSLINGATKSLDIGRPSRARRT